MPVLWFVWRRGRKCQYCGLCEGKNSHYCGFHQSRKSLNNLVTEIDMFMIMSVYLTIKLISKSVVLKLVKRMQLWFLSFQLCCGFEIRPHHQNHVTKTKSKAHRSAEFKPSFTQCAGNSQCERSGSKNTQHYMCDRIMTQVSLTPHKTNWHWVE